MLQMEKMKYFVTILYLDLHINPGKKTVFAKRATLYWVIFVTGKLICRSSLLLVVGGGVDRGSRCCMSIIRNVNVALSILGVHIHSS